MGTARGSWEPSDPLFTPLLLDASGLWRSKKYPGSKAVKMQEPSEAIHKLIGGRCKDSRTQKPMEIC